jgi:hypothetical protein
MRVGQEPPGEGDLVVARGYVLLPANSEGEGLKPDIQFKNRLVIGGGALNYRWGYTLRDELGELTPPGQWRLCFFVKKGQTWREAMIPAWEQAHAEIMKLEEALAQRKRALEEAECPENRELTAGKGKRRIQIGRGNDDHKDQ